MGRTAVLVMEMQRGVVEKFPDLAAPGMVATLAMLLDAARAAGVPVIHCTAAFRADRAGSHVGNCPFIVRLLEDPAHMLEGTAAVEVLAPLLGPGDLESRRYHGFSPFTGTSLDVTLRSLGVSHVVATGVSLNLGIPGLALEAVNLGYRVTVVTDAVSGTPQEYARAVLRNTISLLATRVTADDLMARWHQATPPAPAQPGGATADSPAAGQGRLPSRGRAPAPGAGEPPEGAG
ncbi:isochorismatase family cysteine hydrolase [Thermoactinospora rubra]|uniref:isochorismatase family cysteine hydrolase n=1 Tax=Thermoactinospora rubra TaxID=1088767 RepID=UPI001F0B4720|nr:isochorismatase family cysteine hydrolase [Thermoactinospora rubra]